jgi:hypothetical protein
LSDTEASPKPFGTLANDKPRPVMPSGASVFCEVTSGQICPREDFEEVAK